MAKKKTTETVPVFTPPLALMLARAEELKGEPLTESQVLKVRDAAPCVLMERADAERTREERGFRDVNPEDCWADWHRARVDVIGRGFRPKLVLCLVGPKAFEKKARALMLACEVEHEFRGPDARMREAFEHSRWGASPDLLASELDAIEKHACVLYLVGPNYPSPAALETVVPLFALAAELVALGATGLKCESSGLAHGLHNWRLLLDAIADASDPHARWGALFDALVQHPLVDAADAYTCGMHLLGKPDLIAAEDALPLQELVRLFRSFGVYQLAECAPGAFASGHTFGTSADAPKIRATWEPCRGYDEDDLFFNPYGRWRLARA